MLLDDLINDYLTDCRAGGLSSKTLEVYSRNLQQFSKFIGPIAVADLCPQHVRRFLAHLQDQGASSYTADQSYRTLNTFFRWIVREGVMGENPVRHVRRPKLPKRVVPRLDSEQVKRLLVAVEQTTWPERNLAMVLLMIDSGLRVGEVVRMELEDLSLEDGQVKVKGKGGKEREVPLGETTKKALRRYLEVRPKTDNQQVFVSGEGKALSVRAVEMMSTRLAKKVGVKRLYPHLLRHTFAKLYLEEGDLKTLQVILGHASIETTAAIYVDPDINDLKRRHKRAAPIDRLLGDS